MSAEKKKERRMMTNDPRSEEVRHHCVLAHTWVKYPKEIEVIEPIELSRVVRAGDHPSERRGETGRRAEAREPRMNSNKPQLPQHMKDDQGRSEDSATMTTRARRICAATVISYPRMKLIPVIPS
jgi:hypothetical protein